MFANLRNKALGLMFRKKSEDTNILITFSHEGFHGIWTPFMRFNIDILFLNKDFELVDVIKNVPPIGISPKTWRIYKPKVKAKYVVEIPTE